MTESKLLLDTGMVANLQQMAVNQCLCRGPEVWWGTIPVCTWRCRARELESANERLHPPSWHLYGFSPVLTKRSAKSKVTSKS